MILPAKNNLKTWHNEVKSTQSEQGDKVNLLLLSASMIFLINATVGLIVAYPKFYAIGNEKCTCNREAFKERLKGKHDLFISLYKLIPKPARGNGNNPIYPLLSSWINTLTEPEAFNEYSLLRTIFCSLQMKSFGPQKTTTC